MTTQNQRNFVVLAAVNHRNCTSIICIEDIKNEPLKYALFGVTLLLMAGIVGVIVSVTLKKKQRIQEATSLTNLPWVETLEIFTVSGMDGAPGIYLPRPTASPPAPPPSYDIVVKDPNTDSEAQQKKSAAAAAVAARSNGDDIKEDKEPEPKPGEEEGLPTYEAAVQMENNLYSNKKPE